MSAVFYTHKGEQIHLDKEIGRGGEGPVYSIQGSPSECAKIYSKKLSPDDHEKLYLMVNNPPNDPSYSTNKHRSIAWPSTILYADSKRTQFAGLVMPKVDLKVFKKAIIYISPDDRQKEYCGCVTWQHLFFVARNISSAIAAIHERGYCIGDINESNVLIAPNALITLIDCDSFQVRDNHLKKIYRCPVGKDDYSAPELQGKSFKDIDRTFETDNFALSVLLFQLLMEGFHPFSGRWQFGGDPPTVQEKIKKGLYPYGRKLNELAPQPDAPPFEIVHPDIQMLFYRCFVDGHTNPQKRPSAKDWLRSFDGLRNKFKICSKNENHRYFEHLQSCPWCKYGKDSFPSYAGHQVALVNPTKSVRTFEERVDHLRTYIDMALSDGVLTNDERDYIIDIGSKLQIPQKEVEKVLNAEIKKYSARPSTTTGAGIPKLEISKTSFDFSNLRGGATASGSFTISNVGGGTLSGFIKSNQKWLKLNQGSIDTTRHKQDVTFYIDTSGLPFGLKDTALIEIQSNGGIEKIAVNLTVEIPQAALTRFRWQFIPAFAVIFGSVGVLTPESLGIVMGFLGIILLSFFAARAASIGGCCAAIFGFYVPFLVLGLILKVISDEPSHLGSAFRGVLFSLAISPFLSKQVFRYQSAINKNFILPTWIVAGLLLFVIIGAKTSSSPKESSRVQFTVTAYRGVNAKVRTEPSGAANSLGVLTIRKGETLGILDAKGDWYKIGVKVNGKDKVGWIHKSLVILKSEIPSSPPSKSVRIDGPPIPYEDHGACPFECCTYREWIAKEDITILQDMKKTSAVAFQVQKDERVIGETGVVIITKPGIAEVIKPARIGEMRVSAGDRIYLLTYRGEGFYKIWFSEKIIDNIDIYEMNTNQRVFDIKEEPESIWWVKIKNSRGQTGWSNHPKAFGNKDACG